MVGDKVWSTHSSACTLEPLGISVQHQQQLPTTTDKMVVPNGGYDVVPHGYFFQVQAATLQTGGPFYLSYSYSAIANDYEGGNVIQSTTDNSSATTFILDQGLLYYRYRPDIQGAVSWETIMFGGAPYDQSHRLSSDTIGAVLSGGWKLLNCALGANSMDGFGCHAAITCRLILNLGPGD